MLEACHLYCDHGYVKTCLKRVFPLVEYGGAIHKTSPNKLNQKKVVQLEKIKIVIIHLKWNAQGKVMIFIGFLSYRSHGVSCETGL
jgi:hypothetical protein